MSLINQMLQDLEARRTDGSGSSSIHEQVRVAPLPRRIPLTWAFGLAALLLATALLSWLWGRQTAPVAPNAALNGQTQIALKMASGILPGSVQQEGGARVQASDAPAAMDAQLAMAHVSDPMPTVMPTVASTAVSTMAPLAIPAAMPLPLAPTNEKGGVQDGRLAPATAPVNAVSALASAPRAASASPSGAFPAASATPISTPAHAVPAAAPAEQTDRSASPVSGREVAGANPESRVPEVLASTSSLLAPASSRVRPAKDVPGQRPQGVETDLPVAVTKQIKEAGPQQRAENEYQKASSLIQQGRNGEALPVLEQALRMDPQNATVRQTLAGLLVDARRNDEAIARLQEGLATDRSQPGMAMLLARLQVDKGDLRPAIETLQRTQSYAGDRADYHAFVAALYQRDSRHKEAVEHYIAALRKSPQNGIWWMGLGISLQAENRLNEARDAFVRSRATSTLPPDLLAFVEQKVSQLR
jgi:MSHA biogenesis protein MshN